MKRTLPLLLALLLLLAGCAAPAAEAPPPAASIAPAHVPGESVVPTVTVTGEGRLTLAPDQATITLGVETRGKDVSEANAENAEAMLAIRTALSQLGAHEEDIKTTNYSIYEDYSYRDGKRRSEGFVINNTIEVTYDQLDMLGSLVDAAVEAGATGSYGIRFGVKDPTARKAELAALAAEDARKQAEAYAAATGRTLAEALSITSGRGRTEILQEAVEEYAMEAPAEDSGTRSANTSFSAGTMELTEQVTICYRME